MKFVVANWKMHGSLETSTALIQTLGQKWTVHKSIHKIIIAPPFPLIAPLAPMLDGFGFKLAAQDCSAADEGAFTGEVSAKLLSELGCSFVIVGHSERRHYHAETNGLIKEKALNALKNNLIPIICIGESLTEYENGTTQKVLEKHLTELLKNWPQKNHVLIAYEPLWAIGTGKTPSPSEINEIHTFIQKTLETLGLSAPVLYGGSVNAQNAASILALQAVDGVLVGGASLKAESMDTICEAAYSA